MAITPVPCGGGFGFDEAIRFITTTPMLRGQSRREVYECLDMFQIWQQLLETEFGQLTGINHRSPPDDPPDLELVFGNRVIGMEHTRLLPPHMGEAGALLSKSGKGGGLPSISSRPANKKEMRDIISGVKAAWSNVEDDFIAAFNLLAVSLRKKMRGMPGGGIIGVPCDLFLGEENQRILSRIACDTVNRSEFSDFGSYTLILLTRFNALQFYSALIRRGYEVCERIGKPTGPLDEEAQELLEEIQAIRLDSEED